MAAVVDFPFEPVTPMIFAGTILDEQFEFGAQSGGVIGGRFAATGCRAGRPD